MVVEQWLEFDMLRDLKGFLCLATNKMQAAIHINFINFDVYFRESIDMLQNKFVCMYS